MTVDLNPIMGLWQWAAGSTGYAECQVRWEGTVTMFVLRESHDGGPVRMSEGELRPFTSTVNGDDREVAGFLAEIEVPGVGTRHVAGMVRGSLLDVSVYTCFAKGGRDYVVRTTYRQHDSEPKWIGGSPVKQGGSYSNGSASWSLSTSVPIPQNVELQPLMNGALITWTPVPDVPATADRLGMTTEGYYVDSRIASEPTLINPLRLDGGGVAGVGLVGPSQGGGTFMPGDYAYFSLRTSATVVSLGDATHPPSEFPAMSHGSVRGEGRILTAVVQIDEGDGPVSLSSAEAFCYYDANDDTVTDGNPPTNDPWPWGNRFGANTDGLRANVILGHKFNFDGAQHFAAAHLRVDLNTLQVTPIEFLQGVFGGVNPGDFFPGHIDDIQISVAQPNAGAPARLSGWITGAGFNPDLKGRGALFEFDVMAVNV